MDECPTLAQVVGSNLRRLRGDRGWLQDDVARRVKALGLSWSPSVVASIEAGTRELHFGELVLAAAALDIGVDDLFAGDGRVRIVDDIAVELSTFWSAVQSRRGVQDLKQVLRDQRRRPDGSLETGLAERGLLGEAEYRAGRQLNVSALAVVHYSLGMYGRVLSQERDARVEAKYGTGLARRSLQAARGHIMRSLLYELEARITEDQDRAEQGGDELEPEWDWLDAPGDDGEHDDRPGAPTRPASTGLEGSPLDQSTTSGTRPAGAQ